MKYFLRGKSRPIPLNLPLYMNAMQILALRQAEAADWHLEFIRRPDFADAIPVVFDQNGNHIGVIKEDGTIDTMTDIEIRH